MDDNKTISQPGRRTVTAEQYEFALGVPVETRLCAFFARFNLPPNGGEFVDVGGETLQITRRLFERFDGSSKLTKAGRDRYLKLLTRTILDPDEIFVGLEEHVDRKSRRLVVRPRRRYLARWRMQWQDGRVMNMACISVFDRIDGDWRGVTAFHNSRRTQDNYLDQKVRKGRRIYARK